MIYVKFAQPPVHLIEVEPNDPIITAKWKLEQTCGIHSGS